MSTLLDSFPEPDPEVVARRLRAYMGEEKTHHPHEEAPYPPGATSADIGFLKAMRDEGITNDAGEANMIKLAHGLCLQLRSGQTIDGIAEHWSLTSERMSTDSARFYARTAAAAYCPEQL